MAQLFPIPGKNAFSGRVPGLALDLRDENEAAYRNEVIVQLLNGLGAGCRRIRYLFRSVGQNCCCVSTFLSEMPMGYKRCNDIDKPGAKASPLKKVSTVFPDETYGLPVDDRQEMLPVLLAEVKQADNADVSDAMSELRKVQAVPSAQRQLQLALCRLGFIKAPSDLHERIAAVCSVEEEQDNESTDNQPTGTPSFVVSIRFTRVSFHAVVAESSIGYVWYASFRESSA